MCYQLFIEFDEEKVEIGKQVETFEEMQDLFYGLISAPEFEETQFYYYRTPDVVDNTDTDTEEERSITEFFGLRPIECVHN